MQERVTIAVNNHVADVRLARPEKMNALDPAMFEAIIEAQGKQPRPPQPGHLRHDILPGRSGRVAAIDNLKLAQIARLAGAPLDQGAGVDLHSRIGDPVSTNEPLYTIYAEFPADFQFAREAAQRDSGVSIE